MQTAKLLNYIMKRKKVTFKTYNKKIQKILDGILPIEEKLMEALSYASTITIVKNFYKKNTKNRLFRKQVKNNKKKK